MCMATKSKYIIKECSFKVLNTRQFRNVYNEISYNRLVLGKDKAANQSISNYTQKK